MFNNNNNHYYHIQVYYKGIPSYNNSLFLSEFKEVAAKPPNVVSIYHTSRHDTATELRIKFIIFLSLASLSLPNQVRTKKYAWA